VADIRANVVGGLFGFGEIAVGEARSGIDNNIFIPYVKGAVLSG
jgi:hypothetical protein